MEEAVQDQGGSMKKKETGCIHAAESCASTTQSPCVALKRSIRKESIEDDNHVCTHKVEAKTVNSESQVTCEIDFVARRSLLRYKCDKCGRECPSKHKLKRHLSTHSDARPFPCKICGRSFKWSEYLQKHMRLQHPLGKKGILVLLQFQLNRRLFDAWEKSLVPAH